jgi:hypothetical protein
MPETYMERHVGALLHPETPEEQTISNLFTELTNLADRYRLDTVMLPAVTGLAQCIIKLVGDGDAGRIDPTSLIRKVEDVVRRAGVTDDV